MSNAYASLTQLKNSLGITATDDDAVLLQMLESASRWIDSYTNREFFAATATRTFDGSGGSSFLVPDLLSVTTLKFDKDLDQTFEETWTEGTDFFLRPDNSFPRYEVKTTPNGNYSMSAGVQMVEIDGLWGYGDGISATPYVDSTGTVDVATTTGTDVTASAENLFAVGQTILAGTEQMYITAIATTTLTCDRGVNGTTAAAQSTATAYIYEYPADITRATVSVASELWKDRTSQGFQSERLGDYSYTRFSASSNPVNRVLDPYRRVNV